MYFMLGFSAPFQLINFSTASLRWCPPSRLIAVNICRTMPTSRNDYPQPFRRPPSDSHVRRSRLEPGPLAKSGRQRPGGSGAATSICYLLSALCSLLSALCLLSVLSWLYLRSAVCTLLSCLDPGSVAKPGSDFTGISLLSLLFCTCCLLSIVYCLLSAF
jgi:hypothetical protein